MKTVAILSILLATAACGEASMPNEERATDETAAGAENADTTGDPAQASAEEPPSETGEQTKDDGLAEARAAVTKIIAPGKYENSGVEADFKLNADGSYEEFLENGDGSYTKVEGERWMRAVDGKACYEIGDNLQCWTVTKQSDGTYKMEGGRYDDQILTPIP